MSATFELQGQEFIALNGGPMFASRQPYRSSCIARRRKRSMKFWEKLSRGGKSRDAVGRKTNSACRGKSLPTVLGQLLQDKDAEKSKRVMNAMLQMDKLDIASLKRANDQQ